MKAYLVLGGSGFIGKALVKELSKQNKVIIADIKNIDEFNQENIEFKYLDFVNTHDFKEYLKGVDTVIHLISTTLPCDGTENLNKEIMENVKPTVHLLDSMVEMGVSKLIFISSGGTVYGDKTSASTENCETDPICSYGFQKLMIEKLLYLYKYYHKMQIRIVRLSNPYGSKVNLDRKQGIIPTIIEKAFRKEEITIWGDGNNIRDYIHIDDAIRGIMAVTNYKGDEYVFNISSGEAYSLNEVISIIKNKIQDYDLEVKYVDRRKCDVRVNRLDNKKIMECTDWKPQITLIEGIDRFIKEYKINQGNN